LTAVNATELEGYTLIVVGVGGSVPLLHATSAQAVTQVASRPNKTFLMCAPAEWERVQSMPQPDAAGKPS
jgi:hypothetical protein